MIKYKVLLCNQHRSDVEKTIYDGQFRIKSEKFAKMNNFFDKLFHSDYYLIGVALIAVCGFLFRAETVALFVLIAVVALNLALTRDITPTFIIAVFASMI